MKKRITRGSEDSSKMILSLKERVERLLQIKCLSQSAFAREIKTSDRNIRYILTGAAKTASSELMGKIQNEENKYGLLPITKSSVDARQMPAFNIDRSVEYEENITRLLLAEINKCFPLLSMKDQKEFHKNIFLAVQKKGSVYNEVINRLKK